MSTTATISLSQADQIARRRSILLVFLSTFLNASAQFLIKSGMNQFSPNLWSLATNFSLIAGYGVLGMSTLLMVLALKGGEMSLLYPIIALTYVWTTLLSYTMLHEHSNMYKNVGVVTIVVGVAVMGWRRNE